MFDPVRIVAGVAAPLELANVDTDVIIRIERLTAGDPAQIGHWAFEALRYLPDGTENTDFVLNAASFRNAPILIAGPNFGCGSSREAAVTALQGAGIRCVISASFGDIFYANCFQNGLLPIRLPEASVLVLMETARIPSLFEVDLERCEVRSPDVPALRFEIDAQRRDALLAGLDDIGLTLRDGDVIQAWQIDDRSRRPWIWGVQK
ncbi:3-isopropylmalate dehydratase small subunit [Sphingomonas sp. QA11]|uniref:3-isopropylmalate dehydratase small subunit n=1 Tax=Sphingomonas sp. QA11 TaxID=2950605 RepID=UPI00234B87AF|nr:3-isopropylmalate dehydratase small subunit [Sphingomonas sp. QA11]WCM25856.1 3-isopropylmalate dehydratase small subunit [Sphingomonas sp. QA11]